ncbi:MAG: hypothetical protein ABEH81_14035 [Halopenitus sp.]
MQKLQDKSGSGVVTLPKDDLDRDDVLTDDGEIPESQSVFVERADEGVYVV